jgi:hypothetical protein
LKKILIQTAIKKKQMNTATTFKNSGTWSKKKNLRVYGAEKVAEIQLKAYKII